MLNKTIVEVVDWMGAAMRPFFLGLLSALALSAGSSVASEGSVTSPDVSVTQGADLTDALEGHEHLPR